MFCENWFLYYYEMTDSLLGSSICSEIYFDINFYTTAFIRLVFAWYVFFLFSTPLFNLFVFLYLKCISYRNHIVRSFFFNQLQQFYLSLGYLYHLYLVWLLLWLGLNLSYLIHHMTFRYLFHTYSVCSFFLISFGLIEHFLWFHCISFVDLFLLH